MWGVLTILASCAALGWAQYDYADVLGKSIWFFEAQRSGWQPDNNRVPWRGHSATDDGNDNGLDLTGGWYDAGDHVKFNFPMASTATLLAFSVVEFKEAYQSAGEYENAIWGIRWATDYFMRCHPWGELLYGQVADGYADHAYWGRPELMDMYRPSFKLEPWAPGSDVAGETAAALAAAAMAWRDSDGEYADRMLESAKSVYDFGYNNRGLYTDHIPASDFYGSTGYDDELALGAAWLYRATGEQQYLDKAREFYSSGTPWALSWDDKNAAVQMTMYIATSDESYANDVRSFLNSWGPAGDIHYTPGGLAWRDQWGPNRYAGNTAFISLLAKKHGLISDDWAKGQIDYMLGSNPRDSSYVCGFGNNPPQRPHHRASSCSPNIWEWCSWDDYNRDAPNPNVLTGALVGGPDMWDNYNDDRGDYIANEVACDYNSGFQGALAGIVDMY